MRAYNVGYTRRNVKKLYEGTWLDAGVITWTLIFTRGAPTKFGRVKNIENSAPLLTTFDLIANISGMDRHIENRKSIDQLHFIL